MLVLKRFSYRIILENISVVEAIMDPNLHLSCSFSYYIYSEMSTVTKDGPEGVLDVNRFSLEYVSDVLQY